MYPNDSYYQSMSQFILQSDIQQWSYPQLLQTIQTIYEQGMFLDFNIMYNTNPNLYESLLSYIVKTRFPLVSLDQKEQLIKVLVQHGSNINQTVGLIGQTETLLFWATKYKLYKLCTILFSVGASPLVKGENNENANDALVRYYSNQKLKKLYNSYSTGVETVVKEESKPVVTVPVEEKVEPNPFSNYVSPIQEYITKLDMLPIKESYKSILRDKIEGIKASSIGSNQRNDKEYIQTFFKIPFGKYASLPVTKQHKREDITSYFINCKDILDKAVYGLENVKEEIIDILSQTLSTNNQSTPRVIGIQGSAGVGKTSLIRKGLSQVLNRPFQSINMGGITDSSYLIGHEQTYVSSQPGIIIQSIIQSGVMNPVLFMDELDKVSQTDKGRDIQNVLVHLTDPIQNSEFQDKYFSGLQFDMSKVCFVFSYNDESLIHPILRDRLYTIRVKDPSLEDKLIIGSDYLFPDITTQLCLEGVTLKPDVIRYILKKYCKGDVGLRGLKKCIETLCFKINTSTYLPSKRYKTLQHVTFPFIITTQVVDDVLPYEKEELKYSHMYL